MEPEGLSSNGLITHVFFLYSRGNKKYFDAFGISKTVMELQRSCSNEQAFLGLNLKSIIFNLNIGKPSALK